MGVEIVPSSERKCTNIPALVFAIVFLVLTIILVTYCGIVASINPKSLSEDLSNTFSFKDACGNICGKLNKLKSTECGDLDKRNLTKLLIPENKEEDKEYFEEQPRKCVAQCPADYYEKYYVCYKNLNDEPKFSNDTTIDFDDGEDILKALSTSWIYILIICFVSLVFSYVFLILFRHAAKYVIWVINIGCVVFVFFIAIFVGIVGQSLEFGIIFGILGFILLGLLIWFRKRIGLVAKLFKEASTALIDAPALLFEPILTFISLIVTFSIFMTFFIIIALADDDEPLVTPAHYCNIISFIFFTQFIIGCQNFVIAGAITRWYFTRDKTKLENPIKRSFGHLLKFHLGSVCLGAILITIVKIIKMIIESIKKSARDSNNPWVKILASCLLLIVDLIDQLMQYLVRNAYVIIAKEGMPFCDSGKRAYDLLSKNIMDVIALNNFGDLVLFVCRLLIVLIAGFVGFAVLSGKDELGDLFIYPLLIGIILAFLIAHCFVMVFEMTVDTIFVCFCIDCEQNDGVSSPYYMSDGLRKIMIEMKEEAGGTFTFGPKGDAEGGMQDGIPMLPQKQQDPQPPYPQQPSYPPIYDPKQPIYPPQSNYPQQPPYPPQSNFPQQPPYPQQPIYPPLNQ